MQLYGIAFFKINIDYVLYSSMIDNERDPYKMVHFPNIQLSVTTISHPLYK